MSTSIPFPPVQPADAAPARKLWIELATRITVQRLHPRSGDEETAAESVRNLFTVVREQLDQHPSADAFEVAALFLINGVLRPYTARWHGWMTDSRFRNPLVRQKFREELSELRERLEAFERLFLEMSKERALDEKLLKPCFGEMKDGAIVREAADGSGLADLGGPVESGIGEQVTFLEEALPGKLGSLVTRDEINRAEWKAIRERRQIFERPAPANDGAPVLDATALCLSGGGIRSATFCLGLVQELVRRRMLPEFDYLSTVSGGGYFGSFLSSRLGVDPEALRKALDPSDPPTPKKSEPTEEEQKERAEAQERARQAEAEKSEEQMRKDRRERREALEREIGAAFLPRPTGEEAEAVRHLRNNSRYLLNGGVWGRVRIFGLLVSGIIINLLMFLPLALAGVLGALGLQQLGYWGEAWSDAQSSMPHDSAAFYAMVAFSALLALFWFALPLVRNRAHGEPPQSRWAKADTFWTTVALALALTALGLAALYCLPALFRAYSAARQALADLPGEIDWEKTLAAISSAAPFVLGLAAARRGGAGALGRALTALFALSGPLLLLFIFFFAGSRVLLPDELLWHWGILSAVTAGLALWAWVFIDINTYGPHRYYRDRLCECYLLSPERGVDHTGVVRGWLQKRLHGPDVAAHKLATLQQLPLEAMNTHPAAPYHLLNATANLPASKDLNLRGRASDFFMFSREYCGGPVCGYVPTRTIATLDPHVDLGTAMAVSGAAASSNMGARTMHAFRFLMTLMNVRLGYWLRNPRSGRRRPCAGAPGPGYLFREMAGWMNEHTGFLNLSDGGHIENLAAYEMLRRRCKFIVMVDGGQEPGMECADLLLLQRYAAIDLGVELEFDLADLALDETRRSRAYAVLGRIRYEPEKSGGALGWLVYVKLAVTGAEPGYVSDYRRQCADFPHQSTGDQIYDEAQFEAYRALGECAAASLFGHELQRRFRDGYGARLAAQASELAVQRAREKGGTAAALEKQREQILERKARLDRAGLDDVIETVEEWFLALASSLLPDNDECFRPRSAMRNGEHPAASAAGTGSPDGSSCRKAEAALRSLGTPEGAGS